MKNCGCKTVSERRKEYTKNNNHLIFIFFVFFVLSIYGVYSLFMNLL